MPGGFPVWVFGRYLKPLDEPGIYEVTGNAVNLRPDPSSDVTNFPLPERLQAGDRVRGIELLDPGKPVNETWVRIWTPPGVHGLLRASSVEALPAGQDGAALWSTAMQTLPVAPLVRTSVGRSVDSTLAVPLRPQVVTLKLVPAGQVKLSTAPSARYPVS